MLSPKQLSEINVHQWGSFDDHFEDSDILVGNGFSINMCERLNYSKLFDFFRNHCSSEVVQVFEKIDTNNFEYVMNALALTGQISKVLGYNIDEIRNLISEIKTGLIECIKETHPTWAETDFDLIRALAVQFLQFRNVYTTNYDVFLYRVILANNNLIDRGQISGLLFEDNFYDLIEPRKLAFGTELKGPTRNIHYLHGALFLFKQGAATYKLTRLDDEVELIKLIKEEMQFNNFPVFVAEGNARDKEDAISTSFYLTYCLNKLRDKRGHDEQKLVSFGFSFSESDKAYNRYD